MISRIDPQPTDLESNVVENLNTMFPSKNYQSSSKVSKYDHIMTCVCVCIIRLYCLYKLLIYIVKILKYKNVKEKTMFHVKVNLLSKVHGGVLTPKTPHGYVTVYRWLLHNGCILQYIRVRHVTRLSMIVRSVAFNRWIYHLCVYKKGYPRHDCETGLRKRHSR
jgi:hypothetical protein